MCSMMQYITQKLTVFSLIYRKELKENSQQVSKDFDERPHRRGLIFHREHVGWYD